MNESQAVKKSLREAFDLVADSLIAAGYPQRVKDIYELVDAGEPALALEMMCSNLYEFDCPISARAYELLAEAGTVLRVDRSDWEILKPHVIK